MRKKIFILALLLLLIAITSLLFFKPKLNPDNISIDYEFKENEDDNNYLHLKLNISNDDITFNENNFYHVYVFLPDSVRNPIIYYQNFQDEEYHIGMDSRTYNIAKNAIKEKNILVNEANSREGFYYNGENYPVVFDYYYYKDDDKSKDTGYIVFSYYEKKFFNDLSWTKLYPITFD